MATVAAASDANAAVILPFSVVFEDVELEKSFREATFGRDLRMLRLMLLAGFLFGVGSIIFGTRSVILFALQALIVFIAGVSYVQALRPWFQRNVSRLVLIMTWAGLCFLLATFHWLYANTSSSNHFEPESRYFLDCVLSVASLCIVIVLPFLSLAAMTPPIVVATLGRSVMVWIEGYDWPMDAITMEVDLLMRVSIAFVLFRVAYSKQYTLRKMFLLMRLLEANNIQFRLSRESPIEVIRKFVGTLGRGGTDNRVHEVESPTQSAIAPWFVDPREVIMEDHYLGQGAFGQVIRGAWRGTPVAVKVIRDPDKEAQDKFIDEISLLAALRHPNVVLFMGIAIQRSADDGAQDRVLLLTEYLKRGSLWDILHHSPDVHLPVGLRIGLAMQTCRGMAYLHGNEPAILHKDLKTANLLIDDQFNVRIADFGLSGTSTGNEVGTIAYAAPEIIAGREYTALADVYSFAIIMWELWCRRKPYDEYFDEFAGDEGQLIYAVATDDLRPTFDSDIRQEYAELIELCWSRNVDSRKTFADILPILQTIADSYRDTCLPGSGVLGPYSPQESWTAQSVTTSVHEWLERPVQDHERAVALVAIDVAAILEFWDQDASRARNICSELNAIVSRESQASHGYLARSEGGLYLCVFSEAAQAASFAMACYNDIAHNPDSRVPIDQLRCAFHFGQPHVDSQPAEVGGTPQLTYFGPVVASLAEQLDRCPLEHMSMSPSFGSFCQVLPEDVQAGWVASDVNPDDLIRPFFLPEKRDSDAGQSGATVLEKRLARRDVLPPLGHPSVSALPMVVNANELKLDPAQVGSGSAGVVHRAGYKDTTVAVKKLYSRTMTDAQRLRLLEAASKLRSITHPNLVKIIGCTLPPGFYGIVMEWGGAPLNQIVAPNGLDQPDRLKIIHDICRGLVHLHAIDLFHGRLTPSNILVDDDGTARLVDFGDRVGTADTMTVTKSITLAWTAPEKLTNGRKLNQEDLEHADCYSLAMIWWFAAAGRQPYSDTGQAILQTANKVAEGMRPSLQGIKMDQAEADMVKQCWNQQPVSRPSIQSVIAFLRERPQAPP